MNWDDLDVWLSIYLSSEYLITYATVILILDLFIIIIRMFGIIISNDGFG